MNLTELNLSRNSIASLDGLAALPRLTTLNLYFNKISSLAEVLHLRGSVVLSSVDLRLNAVTKEEGYRRFVLSHLPSLTSLDERRVTSFELESAALSKAVRFADDALTSATAKSPARDDIQHAAVAEVAAAVGTAASPEQDGPDLSAAELTTLQEELGDSPSKAPPSELQGTDHAVGSALSFSALLDDPEVAGLPPAVRTKVAEALSAAQQAAIEERDRHAAEVALLRRELTEAPVEAALSIGHSGVRTMSHERARQRLRASHSEPSIESQVEREISPPADDSRVVGEVGAATTTTYTVGAQTDPPRRLETEAQTDLTGEGAAEPASPTRSRRRRSPSTKSPSQSRGRGTGRGKRSVRGSKGRPPVAPAGESSDDDPEQRGSASVSPPSSTAAQTNEARAVSRELLAMLRESHDTMREANARLASELDEWKARYARDAASWQRNFAELRGRYENVAAQLARVRAARSPRKIATPASAGAAETAAGLAASASDDPVGTADESRSGAADEAAADFPLRSPPRSRPSAAEAQEGSSDAEPAPRDDGSRGQSTGAARPRLSLSKPTQSGALARKRVRAGRRGEESFVVVDGGDD